MFFVQIAERQNSNTISPILIHRDKYAKYCLLFCHTVSNFISFLNSHLQILYKTWCGCIRGIQHFLCATLVWLFSTVCFQMSPQTVCTRRCIVTLVTIVLFFSTVCFQMSLQINCRRECRLTLAFSDVSCLKRGMFTLVAFVWLFSTVRF